MCELNFTDMYEEFNELSALMKTMQSEREDLSMGNDGDKRKFLNIMASPKIIWYNAFLSYIIKLHEWYVRLVND